MSETMRALMGKTFPVLDQGFVRVVDYMGGDHSVVQAARISYGQGTKKIHEDRGLIRYLMRHHHTTPFEMCEIKLHVRVPMDCWRQWIRHRTANINEYSTRYSEAIDATQITRDTDWRIQSKSNRQGSESPFDQGLGQKLSKRELELHSLSQDIYQERLTAGVAREQARKDLPLSTYTEAYWKIDLHNLFHFLALRMDQHAQQEIREYAITIGNEIVAHWCPVSWEAFVDYHLEARRFSAIEWSIIKAVILGKTKEANELAIRAGFIEESGCRLAKSRERRELEEKLREINLLIPWLK